MKYILPLIIVALVGWQCCPSHGASAQSSPKKKSETKKSVSVLEQVNSETLKDVLDDNDEVLVLFYEDNKTPNARKLVTALEKIDLSDLPDVTFVRISDLAEAEEFGLGLNELPRIIFFQNSIPKEYSGDLLDLKALKTWVKEELESIDVDELDLNTMEKIVEGGSPFVIMFVDDPKRELKSEAAILKVADKYDIGVAKVEGLSTKYGIDVVPTFVYFEDGIPSVYDEESDVLDSDPEAIAEWIEEQRTSSTIEEVTEEILKLLVRTKEFVAVFFTGPCNENAATDQECETVLHDLENIDDDLDDFGIKLVTTEDIKYAGQVLKIRRIPSLGIFRNGQFKLYEGPLNDESELLSWLVDTDTLDLPGTIEKVNDVMLDRIITETDNVAVFFYDDEQNNKELFKSLELVDDKLDKLNVPFVKFSDPPVAKEDYAIDELPRLMFFDRQIPIEFPKDGKLTDDREVFNWLNEELENEAIRVIDMEVLERLVEATDDLVVVFHDATKKKHTAFIEELEFKEDGEEDGNEFLEDQLVVRLETAEEAKKYDLYNLPTVVHYDEGIPNVYDDDLTREAIEQWLQDLKIGPTIEKVTPAMLKTMTEEEEYVVALFLNNCDKNAEQCEATIDELENIAEALDDIGVVFVYVDDESYAAKMSITSFPAIMFFRNGEQVMFEGHVENEMAVLKFVTDLNNLMIPGKIEETGISMLEFLMKEQRDVFALLYEEDDGRAKKILQRLESIDNELDKDNIILVKCSDEGVEDEYGLGYLPRLVYFEGGVPEPFVGDEQNPQEILKWIQDELKSQDIKEVTKEILDKLNEKFDTVGAVFIDADNKEQAKIITGLVSKLDKIVEEELVIVQIDDADYAEQLGLTDPPTLVQFSGEIPNLYNGPENAGAIVSWLAMLKEESVIESVTDSIISDLIEDQEFVAVFFSGSDCVPKSDDTSIEEVGSAEKDDDESVTDCEKVLRGLETIDDELNAIGIAFVQTANEDYPFREHAIETFPAVGIYRNGDFLQYLGDNLNDEEEIRKFLMDEDTLLIPGVVEKVNSKMLSYLYENDDKLVVFFYDPSDRDADDIIDGLEQIDELLDADNVSLVIIDEEDAAEPYGILDLPALVLIQNGIPNFYEEDVLQNHSALAKWISEEAKITRINEVTKVVFNKLMDKIENLVCIFYDMEEDPTVENLQKIAGGCQENNIGIVKINDASEAEKYGLKDQPIAMFIHNNIPSLMVGNIEDPDEVLEWVLKQQSEALIEEVTDEILTELVDSHEYVAVYFRGDCDSNKEIDCDEVLADLETIDEDLDEIGIMMTTTKDTQVAIDNGVREFPAIGLFRNGQFVQFEGESDSEKDILEWLTDEETLKIVGIIDEVNLAMLENILEEQDDAFVFFYEEGDTDAFSILEELEQIDEKLDKQDMPFVKISDKGSIESFGIEDLPVLVYFENGVPELYPGELLNDGAILKWMLSELKQEEIKELTVPMLDKLVERGKTMAVIFYEPGDKQDIAIMESLEKIDDDCRRFEIDFIKVSDINKAATYGIDHLPGLLYFENRIPSMYDGDLALVKPLLEWLIEQKTTDTIEQITEEILEILVDEEEYLAVFFSGPCEEDDPCHAILDQLEDVDSTMQDYGIMLVTTEEREFGKTLGIISFPALALFRNGEYVPYEGDLEDELGVLEWITDKETLLIKGKIEKVNGDLLDQFISTETDILVFIYRENNLNDADVIDELEHIDDELEEKDVELIKCSDKGVEKEYGLGLTPILVHFHNQVPNVFKGELEDENEILAWINENLVKDEIDEVAGAILDVLIERLDNLAVIFYDNDKEEDLEFITEMENLDDECDDISVPLVKISDENKALQFGLEESPSLIYFKREIPGMYDGPMTNFKAILKWIRTRKMGDNIQLISETMLEDIKDKFPYVALFFMGKCDKGDDACKEKAKNILDGLETINDDVNNVGIEFVMTREKKLAKREYGVSSFPALGLFRNGDYLGFDGDISRPVEVVNWLTGTDALEVADVVEKVTEDMLENIIELEDDVLAFFYDEEDGDVDDIMTAMESIDQSLSDEEVEFVRCSAERVVENYGLSMIPSLVYFENGVPSVYTGDLKNPDNVLGWITQELQQQIIKEVTEDVMESVQDRREFVGTIFYNKDNKNDLAILDALETIDDECKENDINVIKISDAKLWESLGIEDSPVLVYYENDVPFVYPHQGSSLANAETVKDWIIAQRNTAAIEEVTDAMLDDIIEEHDYVAVLFTGLCADEEDKEKCDKVAQQLEKIDTLLDNHGIVFVMTAQLDKARELWVSRFPALVFFRNGDPIKYSGDLTQAKITYKWLINPKNLFMPNVIEEVNDLMLAKMLQSEPSMFVFFYEEDDIFSRKVLRGLEEIDDRLDALNVEIVKICDDGIDDDYELESLPSLVHFRKGQPTVYYGDLKQDDEIALWIDAQRKAKK